VGTLTNFVFIFLASWVFFKILDAVVGMRVSAQAELEGLDVPEMGVHGYPEIHGPSSLLPGAAGARSSGMPVGVVATERAR
jgi:Amt family ammonium transporter